MHNMLELCPKIDVVATAWQEVYPLLVKSLFLIDVPLWFKLKQKVLDYFLNNQAKHKVSI